MSLFQKGLERDVWCRRVVQYFWGFGRMFCKWGFIFKVHFFASQWGWLGSETVKGSSRNFLMRKWKSKLTTVVVIGWVSAEASSVLTCWQSSSPLWSSADFFHGWLFGLSTSFYKVLSLNFFFRAFIEMVQLLRLVLNTVISSLLAYSSLISLSSPRNESNEVLCSFKSKYKISRRFIL